MQNHGAHCFNQHVADADLIHSVEISDDEQAMAESKMSSSHIADMMKDGDIKSMKSYKSKGSIKSEIFPGAGGRTEQREKAEKRNTLEHTIKSN